MTIFQQSSAVMGLPFLNVFLKVITALLIRTVTELGQKITFLYVYYAKIGQKIENFDLFKNPSFKIENLLAGHWPYVWP